MPIAITSPVQLDGRQRASVLELAAAVEAVDGAPPLSDQARTQLHSDQVHHYVASDGDRIIGYAQLQTHPPAELEPATGAAELVGEAVALPVLLDGLLADASELEVWAHGARSRLIPQLDQRGFERDRVLWQLRWTVAPIDAVPLYGGVSIRPFAPGQDETAWLAVNAAAFAAHPEQGGWTQADLEAREAEPWFDPAGFLLAWFGPELVGFHWTKQHSPTLGEVYVLAVAPNAQRMSLGKSLLIAGLEHLHSNGVTEVLLYVDESNAGALALYEKYGFRRFDHDVQYRHHAAT